MGQAGLGFKGNDGKRNPQNLGETLEIVGKDYEQDKFNATSNNIAVTKTKDNKLELALNEDLRGMNSFKNQS